MKRSVWTTSIATLACAISLTLAASGTARADAGSAWPAKRIHFTLDQVRASGLGCGGDVCELAGQLTIRHPTFGRGNIVRLTSGDGYQSGLGFIDETGSLRWALDGTSFMTYDHTIKTDRTHNIFMTYGFGGPGMFLLVLRPVEGGFDTLGTGSNINHTSLQAPPNIGAFEVRVTDTNHDGRKEILLYDRHCDPGGGCGTKPIYAKTLHWNGHVYA